VPILTPTALSLLAPLGVGSQALGFYGDIMPRNQQKPQKPAQPQEPQFHDQPVAHSGIHSQPEIHSQPDVQSQETLLDEDPGMQNMEASKSKRREYNHRNYGELTGLGTSKSNNLRKFAKAASRSQHPLTNDQALLSKTKISQCDIVQKPWNCRLKL
jgi:hypothetical protein